MADDLELGVRSIEGEGPSPDFVATLRERVLAEATTVVRDDAAEIVDVDLRPPKQQERSMTRIWILTAAAAAVVALIIGVVALTRDDMTVVTDEPTPGPTVTAEPTAEPTPTPEPTVEEDAVPFPDAELLPTSFGGIPVGTHWTDRLGIPFSFTIDQSLFLQQSGNSGVFLSSPSSDDPGDLGMDFVPLEQYWNPARAGLDDPSAAALVAHLESLEGRVVLSNREDVTIGGRAGVRFDITVDTSSCGPDTDPCEALRGPESGLHQTIEVGWIQRVWVIEDGDVALAVVASIWTEDDAIWLDVIERYVATMTFAEAAG